MGIIHNAETDQLFETLLRLESTQECYERWTKEFLRLYGNCGERLGLKHINGFLSHLAVKKKLQLPHL